MEDIPPAVLKYVESALSSRDAKIKALEEEIRKLRNCIENLQVKLENGEAPATCPVTGKSAYPTQSATPSGGGYGNKNNEASESGAEQVATAADDFATDRTLVAEDDWKALFTEFYKTVCADKILKNFFRGTKLASLKMGQMCFFRQLYRGERPKMASDVHWIWAITDAHFTRFLEIFRDIFKHYTNEKTLNAYMRQLETFRPEVVVNQPPPPTPTVVLSSFGTGEASPRTQDEMVRALTEAFSTSSTAGQPPPDHCLEAFAGYLFKVSQSMDCLQEPAMLENVRQAHRKVYINVGRCSWIRSILAEHPFFGKPHFLRAFDKAEFEATDGLRERMEAALIRIRGNTRLKDTVLLTQTLNEWYRSIKNDEVLKAFFGRGTGSAETVANSLFQFIYLEVLSGGTTANDKLARVHANLYINHNHFDRFIQCLMRNVHNDNLRDEFVAFMERYRPVVVRSMVLQQVPQQRLGEGSAVDIQRAVSSCPFYLK